MILLFIGFTTIWNGIWNVSVVTTTKSYLNFTDPGSGSNYGVYIGQPPNLDNIDSAITVFVRCKGKTSDGGVEVLTVGNFYVYLYASTGYYRWQPNASAYISKQYPPNPYDGSWHTVACTYDSAGGANNTIMQIDGIYITKGTKTGGIIHANNLWLGTRNGNTYYLNAYISEIQIYSRILDSTEIAWLHANEDTIYDTTALHLFYPMNEGIGDTVYDYSNYANHGEIRSGVSWVTE